jgi:PadR family transcriptional regulator, regulatory protein AphA
MRMKCCQSEKGDRMENVVLGLLILRNQTLYELNKAFEQGISLFYSASYGSLQTAIKNLVKKGFIDFEEQVDNGRNKKVYFITSEGKEAFFEWMDADIPTKKLEVTALSKVYFLGLVNSTEQRKQIIEEIIKKIEMVEKELKGLNNEIKEYEIPDELKNISFYQVKTLHYGIQAHTFAKEWFETLLRELD